MNAIDASARSPRIVLACMPWGDPKLPSIQLGILHASLQQAGIDVVSRSYHLRFLHFLRRYSESVEADAKLTDEDYRPVRDTSFYLGLGDWAFAHPPVVPADRDHSDYLAYLSAAGFAEFIPRLSRMRALAPVFIEHCVRDITSLAPQVVGFSVTFNLMPALMLSRALKEAMPQLHVVFGGSQCDGIMGEAMHRAFPWIDVVVRGEGEGVLPNLVRELAAGSQLSPKPGLVYWQEGVQRIVPQGRAAYLPPNDIPSPNYDEYFEFLEVAGFEPAFRAEIKLPFKTSRGCWWGDKTQCTFCGISDTAYSSKESDQAYDDLIALSAKYRVLTLYGTDWIMSHEYFRTLLPRLRDSGFDLEIFWEMKANLKRKDVALLAQAGIKQIQAGIESLSTPVLKVMRKGVTGLSNIRLLKLCKEYGVEPYWNLLYGFPGEPADEFTRMLSLLPTLAHLPPPVAATAVILDRFSVYHNRLSEFPMLQVLGPLPYYQHLYPLDRATLMDLSYSFEHRLEGQALSYVDDLKNAVRQWRENAPCASLVYQRGPRFVRIVDQRKPNQRTDYELAEAEALIYLACEDGASLPRLVEHLHGHGVDRTETQVERFLHSLADEGLVHGEGDHYLSLALPCRPRSARFDDRQPLQFI